MDVFKWSHDFETNLEEVDKQHHKLVDITNELGYLLSNNEVKEKNLEKVFNELVDYTQYHFDEEEKVMHRYNLDIRHISNHKEVHKNFVQDVLDMKDEISLENNETSKSLFNYLMNWLVYHILGLDMCMSRQIQSIKEGKTPLQAFEKEIKRSDGSTATLLHSLSSLFEQISQKNKNLKELNKSLEEKVVERTKELYKVNEKLLKLATTDSLTNLFNRRQAMDSLNILWKESLEKGFPISCMMIDADNFKEVNDTYGHDAGDEVLRVLAKTIQYTVRNDDIVCRLGGDEFFVICPLTDEDGVLNIANIVHKKINELDVKVGDGLWKGSISVGITTKNEKMKDINDFIKQADLGVYSSKKGGKNRVSKV